MPSRRCEPSLSDVMRGGGDEEEEVEGETGSLMHVQASRAALRGRREKGEPRFSRPPPEGAGAASLLCRWGCDVEGEYVINYSYTFI